MKDMKVEMADVWVAGIKDRPGGLAELLDGLQKAGADLNFLLARRAPDQPGEGVVFVTPLEGDEQIEAARKLGFDVVTSVKSLRIEGENHPGAAADVAKKLAEAGINLRGFSGAAAGPRSVFYIGFDSAEEAAKAVKVLEAE